MRTPVVLWTLSCFIAGNAFGQQPSVPDACVAGRSDLAEIIACRRSAEEDRQQRCAPPRQARVLAPTSGRRVLSFGENTRYGSTSKGVVFESDGQSVIAPSAGRVLFAGGFRSYGNIIVIDACDIDVLVAGIETISAHDHVLVEEGQVIGDSADGNVVYLEVRRGNKPIDPFGSLAR